MTSTHKKSDILLQHYLQELIEDPVVAAREILGIELAPHQRYFLRKAWTTPWVMMIWGRGSGKSFCDAIYAALCAVLFPNEKIVIVGPGFRQAQFVFKYIESFIDYPVFRDCLVPGKNMGITHGTSEWSMSFKNGSVIYAVPLGSDGSKIRGYRANRLIIDEAVQVPPKIIDTVLIPFMSTTKNPLAKYLGEEDEVKVNSMLFSSSGYFAFNHLYTRYLKYLKKIFIDHDPNYFVCQFSYLDAPEGFIDPNVVDLAREQSTEAEFLTEWMGEWVQDTTGFYPASLLDLVGDYNLRPELKGHPDCQYVLGVDPATSYNTCGFTVMKLADSLQVVRVEAVGDTSYPQICSRILYYMNNYNIVRIGLDAGAGKPILDMFEEGRPDVTPSGKDLRLVRLLTVDAVGGGDGKRVIQVIPAQQQALTELNFGLKANMESGLIKWPRSAGDDSSAALLDKELVLAEINQMESEFRLVEATQTKAGHYSFSVPPHHNKDRYSATLFAFAAARGYQDSLTKRRTLVTGFWG